MMNWGSTLKYKAFAALLAAAALCGVVALWAHGVWPMGGSIPDEAPRLAELLAIQPGMTVAEIGAGDGELTVEIARRLGADGRIYSTELDRDRLSDIREAAARAQLSNVVVVEAAERETRLPEGCCQAIFMRNVYHHITDPKVFNASLRRGLQPGGRLAIIDFGPRTLGMRKPQGVPRNRGGHGIPREMLIAEITGAGFEMVRTIENWSGDFYLVLFRAI